MSQITPKEFMKFCINQGFEFVMVDEDNKVINKDNIDELDSIIDKNKKLTHLSLNKTENSDKEQ